MFFLMSYGWGTTSFDIYRSNKPACMKVIVLGATLYLLMFVKNLGTNSLSISNFVMLFETSIYVYLIYNTPINIQAKLKEIKNLEEQDEVPDAH